MELGCNPKGYSHAGNDTMVWYCAVLIGRQSTELYKIALKEKRLTFAWVDGEAQKRFCLFYVNGEDSHDTWGPRRDITDIPRLFLVHYKRNDTEANKNIDKNSMNMFATIASRDVDPTSHLVSLYKGLDETSQARTYFL
ncbi:hypothetical protein L2E82_49347 [Cichorium intybus]|uniref:Uncharacterized protein n=1 Tax=Cichorium intybus TaxID=13427 RepID=A0ACB8Z0E9_CICIN|nr:hypothetical protein L2E82_49347 [Cichorium intybus]